MIQRVLIVSSTGMGDSLWGTPGIRALKKSFPEIEIDLVVNRPWISLFEYNPYLNKIFDYCEQWYLQPLLGLKLFRKYYDAIFIFHANNNFKRILPWLGSMPIWCHQNLKWVPESHRLTIDSTVHAIKKRLILLEKIGVTPDGGNMEIFLDQNTMDSSLTILRNHDFRPEQYVYLNLGAAVESRRWMVESFCELASRILKETPWNIILGGGPNEKSRAQIILGQFNNDRMMEVCSQPILVNAGIISRSRLMVTSDTGPMHIGFAMGIPVIALFGTISPIGSGPYEIPDHLCKVITVDLDKKDYAEGYDPGEFHFKSITVDQVWNQVKILLPE